MFHPTGYFVLLFFAVVLGRAEQPQPVVHFTFDRGNLTDEISGIVPKAKGVTGSPDRFGNRDFALYFHGTQGSYLNLGENARLKPRSGSISLWFRIDHPMLNGIGVEVNPIITTHSHSGDDHNEAYFIGYDLNTKNINANTSYSKEHQVTVYTTSETSLNKWHHAVLTYDDSFLCFYLDGVLEIRMEKNFPSVFLAGDSVMIANRSGPKNARFFNGSIDDVMIFDRVLTPAEVTELYKAPDPNRSAVVFRWVIYVMLIATAILLLVWFVRRRIARAVKRERERMMIRNRLVTQEMQVLKAQMDPHFIFNALNTIQQFIVSKENEKARVYLTKFSRLIRRLLESNTSDNITLSDEVEIIRQYLEIESLRFNNVFEYHISVDPAVDPARVKIPHFIVQPFVENAIWHGLLPKEGHKKVDIRFSGSGPGCLTCIVEDNGVGLRQGTENLASKKRSLAIGFVKQRLEAMGRMNRHSYDVHITERIDENNRAQGTVVVITMPVTSLDDASSNN